MTPFADIGTMNQLKEALDSVNTVNEFHEYDADHAFMNNDQSLRDMTQFNPGYSEDVAQVAWVRMGVWWDTYLL